MLALIIICTVCIVIYKGIDAFVKNMIKEVFVFVLAAVACHAVVPPPPQVVCGEMPDNIFKCSQIPSLFTPDLLMGCKSDGTPCGKYTCLSTAAGFMKDGKVDKQKAKEYYDAYATRNPTLAAAINHAKAACLGDKDLPAQGTLLNCPTYDIMHCTLTSFLKNVPLSNWLQLVECEATYKYARYCPICPNDCIAPQVPVGSCNACLALPRSA